ncbi:helix-turn-helix transcriptional regulator [Acidovorax sp. K2F]|uniref:S24 family peptidase n=1 Tax=Acidovorax sp. K2F TaxID=2978125 RepID=UPI0021B0C0A7|nr:S24 family peptidase [Acidovorax sp. K2F]MCT6721647.1 helix-turn-helix transcriptional regulator [Acidovorax sp. K2F]
MQIAYAYWMEDMESPRKRRRRLRLELLLRESGGAAQVARETGTPKSHFSALTSGSRGLGDVLAAKLEAVYAKPRGWFDLPLTEAPGDDLPPVAPSPHEAPAVGGEQPDLVITQYAAGGSMGNGFELEDTPPGFIRSWRVSPDWLRLNVPVYSSLANLCIVTGFGPSMKPRYNPGDPLLCDRGFTTVDTDGVYFFRVDGHGFIKQLQRIPTKDGLVLRAKSFNPDYDPFDIDKSMDFQVFGKILTAWRSEQF